MEEGKKISELTLASELSGDERLVFAKDGSNGAVTTQKLKEHINSGLLRTISGDDYINAEKTDNSVTLKLKDAALPGRAVVTVGSLNETLLSGELPAGPVAFTPGSTSGRWKALGYPQAGDIVEIRFEDETDYTLEAVITLVEVYDEGLYHPGYYCKLDLSDDAGWQMPYYMQVYQAMPGSGNLNTDEYFTLGYMANYAAGLTPAGYFFTGTGESALASNSHAWEHLHDAAAADAAWVQILDDGITYRGLLQQRTQSNALVSVNDGTHFRWYSITKAGDTVTVTRVDNAEFNTEVASHTAPIYTEIQQLSEGVNAVFDELWRGCYDCSVNSANAEKPYTCNGLALTRAEAIAVYNSPRVTYNNIGGYVDLTTKPKTLILGSHLTNGSQSNFTNAFRTTSFEALRVAHTVAYVSSAINAFYGCVRLERILGDIGFNTASAGTTNMFGNCVKLQEVRLYHLMQSVSFADSPLLSLASLQYMVENAANTSVITVTVHPDVYAKLTGDFSGGGVPFDERVVWQQLGQYAWNINIQFVTTE